MQFVTLPDAVLLTGQPQECIEQLFKNSLYEKFVRVFGTNSYIHLEFLSLHFPALAPPTCQPVVYQSLASDHSAITEDDQSILRQIVGGSVQAPTYRETKPSQPLTRLYDQLDALEKNAIPLIPEEKAMEIERIKQEIAALGGSVPTATSPAAPHPTFPGPTAAVYPMVRRRSRSVHRYASATFSASLLFFLLSLLVFSILWTMKAGHQAQGWLREHPLPLKRNGPRLSS